MQYMSQKLGFVIKYLYSIYIQNIKGTSKLYDVLHRLVWAGGWSSLQEL